MKKLIIWLGGVPASIRKSAKKALKISSFILKLLQSDKMHLLKVLIPGDWDNVMIEALTDIVKLLDATLKAAVESEEKKMIAGKIGAMLTQRFDGVDSSLTYQDYTVCFEKIYREEKTS